MTKIFLDMDGVLADFDAGLAVYGVVNSHDHLLKSRDKWTDEEKKMDAAVVDKMSLSGFFRNLSLMKDAHSLWLAAGDPYVLTARPKYREGSANKEQPDFGDRVSIEKQEWLKEFFDIQDDRFICCLRSEKALYARSEYNDPNILVDDLLANCQEWEKAGGVAILFRNMEQAVNDLIKARKIVTGR